MTNTNTNTRTNGFSQYLIKKEDRIAQVEEENRSKGVWDAHIHSSDMISAIDRELVEDDDYWKGFCEELRRLAMEEKEKTKEKGIGQIESMIF